VTFTVDHPSPHAARFFCWPPTRATTRRRIAPPPGRARARSLPRRRRHRLRRHRGRTPACTPWTTPRQRVLATVQRTGRRDDLRRPYRSASFPPALARRRRSPPNLAVRLDDLRWTASCLFSNAARHLPRDPRFTPCSASCNGARPRVLHPTPHPTPSAPPLDCPTRLLISPPTPPDLAQLHYSNTFARPRLKYIFFAHAGGTVLPAGLFVIHRRRCASSRRPGRATAPRLTPRDWDTARPGAPCFSAHAPRSRGNRPRPCGLRLPLPAPQPSRSCRQHIQAPRLTDCERMGCPRGTREADPAGWPPFAQQSY